MLSYCLKCKINTEKKIQKFQAFKEFESDFKELTRRIASDKALYDKAFDIAKNPKYDGYEKSFASMVCKFFDKKWAVTHTGSGISSNLDSENQQLANEGQKPVIRKF